MTITQFLLARIAEDEAAARLAWPARWEQDGDRNAVQTAETGLRGGYEGLHMGVAHCAMTVGSYRSEARNAAHIARHDPARVLAECEAKRRIVGLHDGLLKQELANTSPARISTPLHDQSALGADLMHQDVLRALASVYADHPDYDEAWS